ncbi:MAG: hypothetical protein R3242_00210 [Akkermansiaceae bacterium]|nr:hypothetical protein [Akkermansiaceae bacterium]
MFQNTLALVDEHTGFNGFARIDSRRDESLFAFDQSPFEHEQGDGLKIWIICLGGKVSSQHFLRVKFDHGSDVVSPDKQIQRGG